jgi:acyl-CoA dehydrogenase
MAVGTPTAEGIGGLRQLTRSFLEERVYPGEDVLSAGGAPARERLAELQRAAKEAGLWALGHPPELGGGGLGLVDYLQLQEEQGRSEFGNAIFGSATRQDVLSLRAHGPEHLQERYLQRLVDEGRTPSLGMTEPGLSGSDPTGLRGAAHLDGETWVINARKAYTTGADDCPYFTLMCRTEPDAPDHEAFTMIIVGQGTEGVRCVHQTPLLGLSRGHWEVEFENVRVPVGDIVGGRGQAFAVAQERLAVGRLLHAARWIGMATRAFELMCARLQERTIRGAPLADKQLMQQHVFDSHAELTACRLMALDVARRLEDGEDVRVEVGTLKVVGGRMQHRVVDRAVQVFGADGLSDASPLATMSRVARLGRIYDGPDEVHIESVARRLLRPYKRGGDAR